MTSAEFLVRSGWNRIEFESRSAPRPEAAEGLIRTLDWDESTVHVFSGSNDLALWQIAALHHWLDPRKLAFNDESSDNYGFWKQLAPLWGSPQNRLLKFFAMLRELEAAIDLVGNALPMISIDRERVWLSRMHPFDFVEELLLPPGVSGVRIEDAPEPTPRKPGEDLVDTTGWPPLARLFVAAAVELLRRASQGGTYVFGDKRSVMETDALLDRLAKAFDLPKGEPSLALKRQVKKMLWPPECGPHAGRKEGKKKAVRIIDPDGGIDTSIPCGQGVPCSSVTLNEVA